MPRGALSEPDGRAFMALLDMTRYLANEITHTHKFESIRTAQAARHTARSGQRAICSGLLILARGAGRARSLRILDRLDQ
eukprot:scaffold1937_cov120-Isochrysis_galbana.AAC.1